MEINLEMMHGMLNLKFKRHHIFNFTDILCLAFILRDKFLKVAFRLSSEKKFKALMACRRVEQDSEQILNVITVLVKSA